jgi:hypothetical protein
MVNLHKSKTKDHNEKDAEIQGWYWSSVRVKCIKLKVWGELGMQLKEIKSWDWRDEIKFWSNP